MRFFTGPLLAPGRVSRAFTRPEESPRPLSLLLLLKRIQSVPHNRRIHVAHFSPLVGRLDGRQSRAFPRMPLIRCSSFHVAKQLFVSNDFSLSTYISTVDSGVGAIRRCFSMNAADHDTAGE